MKKVLIFLLYFGLWSKADAQNIVQYEYWYDSNYSSSIVVNTSPTSTFDLSTSLTGTSGLTFGLHTVNFRAKDDNGKWSSAITEQFYSTGNFNVVSYEYWFDNDYASKVTTSISPTQTYILASSFNTTGIGFGLHALNFRSKDSNGRWSSTIKEQFYASGNLNIDSYEYWFDDNYAAKITNTVAPSQTYILTSNFDTSAAGYGLHALNFRSKDSAGKWSVVIKEFFFKSVGGTQLTNAEYWIDSNFANRQTLTFTSNDMVFINQSVLTSNLDDQLHTFNFRMQDQGGKWSVVTSSYFMAQSQIVAYEYWFDSNFATKVNATIVPTTLLDLESAFDSTQLGVGTHTVHFRAKNSSGRYSSTLSHNFNVIITAPPIASNQELFNSPTVSNLVATGTDLKWYTSATLGTNLAPTTPLITGTYYVSQTINSRESIRIPVNVTVTFIIPSALTFCKGVTVSGAIGSTSMKFYTALTKGTLMLGTSNLNSRTVFATQTVNGIESAPRVPILITVNPLPIAPTPVVLTDGLTLIKKVGDFIATTTSLTLTATPAGAVVTDHYNWTLPIGVNQLSGNDSSSITINFANVIPGNTNLEVFISAVSAEGCVSKSARKLTLTRAEPKQPKGLTLTDSELPEILKIKKLDSYTGLLKNRILTLTANPNTTLGFQSSSYRWILPSAVTTTATPVIGQDNTYTSTSNVIEINLSNYSNEASLVFKVFGVNGNGTSLISRDLTCTVTLPKTPGAITTPLLTKPTYNTTCNNVVNVQVPSILGISYTWFVDGGAVITAGQGSNALTIDTSIASATLTISVTATNGLGTSLPKILTLKKSTTCRTISEEVVGDEFSIIAYPNPSENEFTIDVQSSKKGAKTEVQVYNTVGQLIEERQVNSNSVEVGRNYSSGVYNVIVTQDTNTKTLRVIKKQ